MELSEIKEIIKSKREFDEYTTNLLAEYLIAVQDCLSDYISLDEAIKRLIESDTIKNGIVRVDRNEIKTALGCECDAGINFAGKCLKLDKDLQDEKYIRYVMFHELTHALSIQKHGEKIMHGFEDISESNLPYERVGINEAVTEYLACKMCKEKYNYKIYPAYPVAVEQLINAMNIIDEKDILYCYFHESEKFDELVQKTFGDPEFFNIIFNKLAISEESMVEVRIGQMPENEDNTDLLIVKDTLYSWYTSKYLPVDTLEKFEEKLKFVKQFVNQHDSLNFIDEYGTYIDILCDMQDLGIEVKREKLEEILEKYGFDKAEMEKFAEFNYCCSTEDDDERTEKAIDLYEKYKKMEREKFADICDTFFMRLHNSFFIGQPVDNNDLWNYMKIPFVGKFLKENPQYDFDELSIAKLEYEERMNLKCIRKDWLYIVMSQDKKIHIIFEDFDDGTCFSSKEVAAGEFELSYGQEKIIIKLNNGKITMKDSRIPMAGFKKKIAYVKKSNYEQVMELVKNYEELGNQERQAEYQNILSNIEKRISDRRKIKKQDEKEIEI